MIADYDGTGFFAVEMAKDLRALAIESLAELDVGRDGVWPPIAFHMSIRFDVAHIGYFPDV